MSIFCHTHLILNRHIFHLVVVERHDSQTHHQTQMIKVALIDAGTPHFYIST